MNLYGEAKMKKMKMRTKITVGLLAVFLISLVVAFYSASAVARITGYIAEMEELTHANNRQADALITYLQNAGDASNATTISQMTANMNMYQGQWYNVREDLRLVGSEVIRTLIMIFAVALIAMFLISYFLPRNVLKPVKQLANAVNDIADGKFDVNIDRSQRTNDELGELSLGVSNLANVIKSIVDDLSNTHKEKYAIPN